MYENCNSVISLEEYIDILDSEGNPTGESCSKSLAHRKGFYHATVHTWFYTKQGTVLLQQRGASKKVYPLLWDVSVAGHLSAGESLKAGAIREIREEIGLTVAENDLIKIGVFKCFQKYDHGIFDNEFHHTYIAELKVDFLHLTIQKEEIEALKLVSIKTFRTLLKGSNRNNHFIASNKKYYKFVLQCILKKISNYTQ